MTAYSPWFDALHDALRAHDEAAVKELTRAPWQWDPIVEQRLNLAELLPSDDYMVGLLVERGGRDAYSQEFGTRLFEYALQARAPLTLSALLRTGYRPQRLASNGHPLFTYAKGAATLELLLRGGLDVSEEAPDGSTPVCDLPAWGQGIQELLAFLKAGANPSARDGKGRTLVMQFAAAGASNLNLFDVLLSQGADAKARTPGGQNALHYATLAIHVGYFIRRGVGPLEADGLGNTPLHAAVIAGRWEVAGEMLRYGALPFAKNHAGESPYSIAKGVREKTSFVAGFLRRIETSIEQSAGARASALPTTNETPSRRPSPKL